MFSCLHSLLACRFLTSCLLECPALNYCPDGVSSFPCPANTTCHGMGCVASSSCVAIPGTSTNCVSFIHFSAVPVNGGWGPYSGCDRLCSSGKQSRLCNNPKPALGGAACTGASWRTCNTQSCPGLRCLLSVFELCRFVVLTCTSQAKCVVTIQLPSPCPTANTIASQLTDQLTHGMSSASASTYCDLCCVVVDVWFLFVQNRNNRELEYLHPDHHDRFEPLPFCAHNLRRCCCRQFIVVE